MSATKSEIDQSVPVGIPAAPSRNGHVATLPAIATPLPVLEPLPEEATGSIALGQSLVSALEALQANKLRSFLTMLGIIIGIGAVIIMVALGAERAPRFSSSSIVSERTS